ncbi:nucleotidyltransferase family protein [Fontibacter flavus]|uniref:Nucleotidyltransferase family protein n=1 Tax=Fontibacter flavus TaxID=654838 RepID=A0ABV6FXJ0_9BACT
MKGKKYPIKKQRIQKVNEPFAMAYDVSLDYKLPVFLEKHREELIDLCKKHHVERMFVFGSVLNNSFSSESDVDFLVKIKEVPVEVYTDSFFEVYEGLQNILNRKVDLLTEKSVSNPYFLEEINKTKTLIYSE